MAMTPFFIGRTPTFVPQIWEHDDFWVRQTYNQFVAQETSIIIQLFIYFLLEMFDSQNR